MKRETSLLLSAAIAAACCGAWFLVRPSVGSRNYEQTVETECRSLRIGMTEAEVRARISFPPTTYTTVPGTARCLHWYQEWSGASVAPSACFSTGDGKLVRFECDKGWLVGELPK